MKSPRVRLGISSTPILPFAPHPKKRQGYSTTEHSPFAPLRAGTPCGLCGTRPRAPSFVDLNLREPWWTQDKVDWCLSTADWIKLNETELAKLTASPTGPWEGVPRCGARGLRVTTPIQGRDRDPEAAEGALSIVDGTAGL